MRTFKHLVKRIILLFWFNSYVKNNTLIQADIQQTLMVRGSKVISEGLERRFIHLMVYYPEFALIFFWRLKKNKPRFSKLFSKDFNCKIFGSTKIDGGLMCYHPFATVINAKSIGHNFQFRNSLTIGNKGNDNNQLPVIGNDVTVGANVVIIGDISVGNNVIIGAGAVVVKDVPSNSIVAGNPAKVIKVIDHV